MNERLNILRVLIENRLFAPTSSAFATYLGYHGRMVIYRLLDEEVREGTVEKVWNDLLLVSHVDDSTLKNLYHSVLLSLELLDFLRSELSSDCQGWIEQAATALITGDYASLSSSFDEKYGALLNQYRHHERQTFIFTLLHFYIRGYQIHAYEKDFTTLLRNFLIRFAKLCESVYPENRKAKTSSENLIGSDCLSLSSENIWGLIYSAASFAGYYLYDDYDKDTLNNFQLFNWGEVSYWIEPGKPYASGERVWMFAECSVTESLSGYYLIGELTAGKTTDSFELKEEGVLMFWKKDKEEDIQLAQGFNLEYRTAVTSFYEYDYDEHARILQLSYLGESVEVCSLPEQIYRIRMEDGQSRDEKIWGRILKDFDKSQSDRIIKEMLSILFPGNIREDWTVDDVIISRSSIILVTSREGEELKYELPVEQCPFIDRITPSDEVIIMETEGEYMVQWIEKGVELPLNIFHKQAADGIA